MRKPKFTSDYFKRNRANFNAEFLAKEHEERARLLQEHHETLDAALERLKEIRIRMSHLATNAEKGEKVDSKESSRLVQEAHDRNWEAFEQAYAIFSPEYEKLIGAELSKKKRLDMEMYNQNKEHLEKLHELTHNIQSIKHGRDVIFYRNLR